MAMFILGICAGDPVADTATGRPANEAGGCGADGSFRVRVYGELTADLRWSHAQLECRGMPRPGGNGARLFFAGPGPGDTRRIAFILALPDFHRQAVGQELASTLTLIEEGNGRFFSTSGGANCLTQLSTIDAIDSDSDRFTVSGAVYCISPLAEVNGTSSISIDELRFTGLLDWSTS